MVRWWIITLLELLTIGFALLGFFCVPLGHRTAYEHVHGVATSPRTREVVTHTMAFVRDVRDDLLRRLDAFSDPPPSDSPSR